MKFKSNVKADSIAVNHKHAGLKVASKVKAGAIEPNHKQTAR